MTDPRDALSSEDRRHLEDELATLRAERDEVAASLRGSDASGDSADQAERLERTMRLERADDRITQITGLLRNARPTEPLRTDVVGIGTTATVRFADRTTQTLRVGEIVDEEDETLVTSDSPLGQALLGHRAGDTVTYQTPQGPASVVIVSLGGAHPTDQ